MRRALAWSSAAVGVGFLLQLVGLFPIVIQTMIAMPYWKMLLILGLSLSFIGAAIITAAAGVPGILPNRPRYTRDVWLWRGAFALIALGSLLQVIGTIMSP